MNDLAAKTSEMRVLLQAMDRSLEGGRRWLENRIVPNGKVTRERSFNFFGKPTWGLWSAGASPTVIKKILDHVASEAVQPNGDLFFSEEPEAVRNGFRLYRALYCLIVASSVGHPLARNPRILARLEQYQSEKTGAVFNYIGDGPRDVRPDPFYAALLTSTSIHLFLQLGMTDAAIRAGKYLAKMVEANRRFMRGKGVFYTQADLDGKSITKIPANKSWCYAVSNAKPKQEFWQIGAIMAALARLAGWIANGGSPQNVAAFARTRRSARKHMGNPRSGERGYDVAARRRLDSALELVRFEQTMLPESYEWPQKCKLAWGGGELLKTCVRHGFANQSQLALMYRVTRNTVVNTFFDAQLPDGSWAGDHYPLCDDAPELAYDYKLLRGFANAPRQPTGSSTCVWFTPEEMTGEFLGEMAVAREGVGALVDCLESRER